MQRRQFISLFAIVTLTAILPRAVYSQTGKTKSESFIALPQAQKIVLLRPTGELLREISLALPNDAQIKYLSASKDGKVLCFQTGTGWLGSNNLTIYTVNSDGTNLQAINPQSQLVFFLPCLSPDGKQISCRPYAKDATLHIMSLDGALRDLGESTKGVGQSCFSKDGQSIFFSGGSDLYHIPIGGGEAQVVLRGYYPEPFDVNPQNDTIAVIPVDNIIKCLATISPEGKVTNLAGLPATYYTSVAWSPDGQECVYTRVKSAVGANDGGLFITSIDNPKPRRLSEDYSAARTIVWR